MDTLTIIRAWKDPEFRALLSPEQRSHLPENPSGKSITELDDSELDDAVGGLVLNSRFYCAPSLGVCPTTSTTRFLSLRVCPTGYGGYGDYGCPPPVLE